jgi:hypothetical protein
MTKIACAAVFVTAFTTVSSLGADSDTGTETVQTMQQMKTEMQQLRMKMHLLQTKMQQMQVDETKTPEKKVPEVKAPEMKVTEPKNPWDVAFGGALMTEFNFRGISASDHRPAVMAYVEPRYNFSNSLQAYAIMSTYSLTLPNHTAAAMELYAGVRPTFDRLALDFAVWEHWLPGGRCFNFKAPGGLCIPGQTVLYVNSVPGDISYTEFLAKATYYVDNELSFGGRVAWTPSVLNSGGEATYVAGWAKYILLPAFLPRGIGGFISAEAGYWDREKSPYPSYTNWNAGLAFTWKQFTLDLRYADTDRHDCDEARTAATHNSNRCGASFVAKLSFDLTSNNLK